MGRIALSFQLVRTVVPGPDARQGTHGAPADLGAIMAVVTIGAGLGFSLDGASLDARGPALYLPIFLMYVVMYAIGIFFQAAVIAGATERMRGGDPTVRSALAAASRRLGPILMWAVVAATVGMALRAIQDRVGFVGNIVAGLAGAAWSLATFFVVPVLVLEDKSIQDSFTQSVSVFKKTWGETMTGGVSLGIAAFTAWATLIAITGAARLRHRRGGGRRVSGRRHPSRDLLLGAPGRVRRRRCIRYATEGAVPPGFDRTLLGHAFVPKRS